MQTMEECLLMYRQRLRQLLAFGGIPSNLGEVDEWILDRLDEASGKTRIHPLGVVPDRIRRIFSPTEDMMVIHPGLSIPNVEGKFQDATYDQELGLHLIKLANGGTYWFKPVRITFNSVTGTRPHGGGDIIFLLL